MIESNDSPAVDMAPAYEALMAGATMEQAAELIRPVEEGSQVAPESPGSTDDQAEPVAPVPAENTLTIGDESLSPDEAKELVNYGRQYKQDLDNIQAFKQLQEIAKQPGGAQRIAEELLALAGTPMPKEPPKTALPVDFDDMSDEGKFLYLEVQRKDALLNDALGLINQFKSEFQNVAQERKAVETAKAVSESLGHEFSPSEIISAMKTTGLDDPKKAVLAVHGEKLLAKSKEVGVAQGRVPKPPAPTSTNKTFNPKDYDGDEIFRMMLKGYTPLES